MQTDNERDLDEIFHDLKKKNPKMEAPKLRLWAKLIESGRYDSYEDPPAIPLITGGPLPGKPKKESLSDAVSGAGTAIVKVLQQPKTPINHKIDDSSVSKISPLKVASLRRSCLEDLKKLKDLLEEGVLTETEFYEEKKQILSTLKNLNK